MPTVAAACCNRSVAEEEPNVEVGGMDTNPRADWHYVGGGNGNYVQAPEYDYVGDGAGSYVPQKIITYRGWKFRRSFMHATGAIVAIAIVGVVVALVVQSHRTSSSGAGAEDQQSNSLESVSLERQAVVQTTGGPAAAGNSTAPVSFEGPAQQALQGGTQAQLGMPGGIQAQGVASSEESGVVLEGQAQEPAVEPTQQSDAKKRQAVPVFNCANTLSMSQLKGSYCCENFGKFCDAYEGAEPGPAAAAAGVVVQEASVVPTAQVGLPGSSVVPTGQVGLPGSIVPPAQPAAVPGGIPMTHMTGAVAPATGVVVPAIGAVVPAAVPYIGAAGAATCAVLGCDAPYNPEQSCQCNDKCLGFQNCCADHDAVCPAGAAAAQAAGAPGMPQTAPPPTDLPLRAMAAQYPAATEAMAARYPVAEAMAAGWQMA